MSVEAIGFLPAANPVQIDGAQAPQRDFAAWLGDNMGQVNDKLVQANHQVQRLAVGDVDNLHEVMLSIEEARLSFQLAMQVRNKVLEAYQEIIRMQI